MALHSQPHRTFTINDLHKIVDDVVIETEAASFYEVVLADTVDGELHVVDEIHIDHATKRLIIVVT